MFKRFLSGKMCSTKHALFFLLGVSTHHSFTFNLRFSYELKHKFRFSKTVREIFHCRFRFVFIKVIYLVNKKYGLFAFKTS